MSFQNNNKYHCKILQFLSVELVSFKIYNKEYNLFFKQCSIVKEFTNRETRQNRRLPRSGKT